MGKKPKYENKTFVKYQKFIIDHPNYKDMPDIYGEKGTIQWEAPSNRKSGKFKDTYIKRLNWWKKKALNIGINPKTEDSWISKTAKMIHPTKIKPCKKCGLLLNIQYYYPNGILLKRINNLSYYRKKIIINTTDNICEVIEKLYHEYGEKVFSDFPLIFQSKGIIIPKLPNSIKAWQKWLVEEYIPEEPSTLSPGAMSNAPDRFDGFHSFNRCCRATADTGRTKENLQSYSTDRRVFEYWIDGDWVTADRLMGQIRSNKKIKKEKCLNGHDGPCGADHIGPISLGFTHRPEFQLLCKSCNSAKNNRLYETDVIKLIDSERKGEVVISWFAKRIWDLRKGNIKSRETALRMSKILRDNRHTYMDLLKKIYDEGCFTFLISLLSLEKADYEPTFINLHTKNSTTIYDDINYTERKSRYVNEQKARRIRIAFKSLIEYHKKNSRNAYVIDNKKIKNQISKAITKINQLKKISTPLDKQILSIINESSSDEKLREIIKEYDSFIKINNHDINEIKKYLNKVMCLVANELNKLWNNERYMRITDADFE